MVQILHLYTETLYTIEVSKIHSCAFNGYHQIAPDLSQCPYNKSLEVISPNTPNKPITLMDYRHFLK